MNSNTLRYLGFVVAVLLVALFLIEVGNEHLGSVCGELCGTPMAEARGPASHQC